MDKKMFNTKWERDCDPPEENTGLRLTESAGFIPLKKRIQQMVDAGARLAEWRNENYDYEGNYLEGTEEYISGDDDQFVDVTRKEFDELDLQEAGHRAQYRLSKAFLDRKEREQAKVAESPKGSTQGAKKDQLDLVTDPAVHQPE